MGVPCKIRGKLLGKALEDKEFPQKKVLSLVLCVAVMLSVMVMGAGAAFSDQDKIENTEAVDMCAEVHPDLVLMDINMPVMDGYDALRLIRERAPDIPVIALTAYAFETDRQRMFQAGFNECLAKPLRADELRSRIASLLSR